jgi:16S rRNA (uracil1498-N3)-methyltransferase
MRLHRFYINQNIEVGKEIRIDDPELLNQWGRVFRLKAEDEIILFNDSEYEFTAKFSLLSKKEAVLTILDSKKVAEEISKELHVFQSIIKKDNFELIVQKCTEIGASAFHPIISERSEKKSLNMERLIKIAKEASEQSGKVRLPKIFEPESLEKAVENFDGDIFALDFGGKKISQNIFAKSSKIGILIGPEGGWSDKERKFFKEKGIKSFSLGSQILRAETASIAISALILLE